MTARPVGALALEFLCDATLTVHADRRTVAARAYADGEALESALAAMTAERDALKAALLVAENDVAGLKAHRRQLAASADEAKAQAAALAGAIEHAANVLDEPVDEATAERLQISLRRTLSENGGGK